MAIKIDTVGGMPDISSKSIRKNTERTGTTFSQQLDDAGNNRHRDTLISLTKDILSQGELLAQTCDIKEFKRYKEMITEFFNELVMSGYSFGKEARTDARGRNKLYANIKQVNEDMEKLAAELLKTQQNQVAVLNMIDDIRGIIIDVMA